MLVQVMFKNILSFKEETIIDMTAIHAYKEHKSRNNKSGVEVLLYLFRKRDAEINSYFIF